MTDPFIGPKKLIIRAEHHIGDLARRISVFVDAKPYVRVIERDGEDVLHKFRLSENLPDDLPNIAFDAFGNIRAALDQAAFSTALMVEEVPKSAHFPVADTAQELENVIKLRCKDIPPGITALFRALKPYKGENDLIWALNRAVNVNKHALLVPVLMNGGWTNMGFLNGQFSGRITNFWDDQKNELTYMRATPESNMTYDVAVSLRVSFGNIDIIRGKPAVAILNDMAREAHNIILKIEAESRNLGLI